MRDYGDMLNIAFGTVGGGGEEGEWGLHGDLDALKARFPFHVSHHGTELIIHTAGNIQRPRPKSSEATRPSKPRKHLHMAPLRPPPSPALVKRKQKRSIGR
jgi:hypothetical protein